MPPSIAPARIGSGHARRCLHRSGAVAWWDAVDMRSGHRAVLRVGTPACSDGLAWEVDPLEPTAAWSPPLELTVSELVPDLPLVDDAGLLAAVLAAGLRALHEGRVGAGAHLADRMVCCGGRWVLLGSDGPHPDAAAAVAALVATLDAQDALGVAGLFGPGAPADAERFFVRALAAHLAQERHHLVRRAAADRRADVAARLRGLAARLAGAMPPPAGPGVRVEGGRLFFGAAEVWDGARLDPRAARALARALVDTPEAQPVRRWVVAMSRLRVDQALLARR